LPGRFSSFHRQLTPQAQHAIWPSTADRLEGLE